MAVQKEDEDKGRQAQAAPQNKAGKKGKRSASAKGAKRPKKRVRNVLANEKSNGSEPKETPATAKKKGKGGAGTGKPRKPLSGAQIVGRILPVVCLALAFVAIVILYRKLMPQTVGETTTQPTAVPSEQVLASSSNPDNYAGLEDKWLTSGLFTTGNKELDMQVKEFCDALTTEGASARDNANAVFNTIVWSTYEERGANEYPSGTEWTIASARHYFAGATPAEGLPGSGDVYDFAATIAFCMRYFGFYDALAVPIVKGTLATGQTGSALVLVSNEYGLPCVCDPTLAAEGFLLDRGLYTITVENIGQDLTAVEALGLDVQHPEGVNGSSSSSVNAGSSSGMYADDAGSGQAGSGQAGSGQDTSEQTYN